MRHYIGVGQRGPAVLRNIRKHLTGEPLVLVDENVTTKVRINFAEWLESGETISSATATATGGVTSSASLSSPNYDVTLSNVSLSGGTVVVLVTSSTSEKISITLHVRRPVRHTSEVGLLDYA